MFRKILVAVLTLSIASLLSGCMKVNLDLTVNDKDEVSGTMVLAFNKEAVALAESMGGSNALNTDSLITEQEGMTVEPYEDENFSGSKVTFDTVPMTEFSSGATGESLKFVRDGNVISVSGVLDMSGDDPTLLESAKNNPLTSGFFDSSDISVSITLPGKVSSTGGTVEGNTVTFKGQLGDRLVIDAKADTSQDFTMVAAVSVGVLALLAAAVSAAAVLRRRTRNKEESASEPTDDLSF